MHISKAHPSQIPKIIKLFQSFYLRHNIFQQKPEIISKYLIKQAQLYPLLIVEEIVTKDTKKIAAVTFIVKTGESEDQTHFRWKLQHFAFTNINAAQALIEESESYIKKQSITSKIELTIAESESNLHFYESQKYDKEATLRNHYRWGETCFVLGKSLKQAVIPK